MGMRDLKSHGLWEFVLDAHQGVLERPEGRPPLGPVPMMGPMGVVEREPGIEASVELRESTVELLQEVELEELLARRLVEPLVEAVGVRRMQLGVAVRDLPDGQEELERVMQRPAAVLPAVIGEKVLDSEPSLLLEGEHTIVQHVHGGCGELREVELPEGQGRELVHDALEVDPTDAFDRPEVLRVLAEQVPGPRTLDVGLGILRPGLGALQEALEVLGQDRPALPPRGVPATGGGSGGWRARGAAKRGGWPRPRPPTPTSFS